MKRILGLAVVMTSIAQTAMAQGFLNWPQNVAWQLDAGADYTSGKYGAAETTDVWSVPVEARVQLDNFRLEATLPYVSVTGPGVVADGIVVGDGPVSTRSGIGDLNLGAAYLLSKDGDLPALELEGIVKAPTAETGLGTGKTDYTLQANLYHAITPRFMLFGSFGYQWLNSFSTFALKNGVQATAGANFAVNDRVSLGASTSYRQEYFRGLGDAFSVSPYILWNIASQWRLSGYGTFGSGKASPKDGFGMRLIFYKS
jgi:hypothetical protein